MHEIHFGARPLTIEEVVALAERRATPRLNPAPEFRARIQRGADYLDRLLAEEGVIYGVTTGYGDSVTRAVPLDLVDTLPLHLTRFHGCGMGENLSLAATRAVLATRLNSLAQGVSGVSLPLLERLTWLLEQDLLPRIPEEGSVGASGDLTPLSYVAAALIGERELYRNGELTSAAELYRELGITPLQLRPKEGLALMNGTSVMTALACLAYARSDYLMRLCTRITALVSVAMEGNAFHFDEPPVCRQAPPGPAADRCLAARRSAERRAAAPQQPAAGSLLPALRASRHRSGGRQPALVAHAYRKRAQQCQRQPPHRRRWGACDARRSLLRRPYRHGDGQYEGGGGQSGRSARPSAGPAGRQQVQSGATEQPIRRKRRAPLYQPRLQGGADRCLGLDSGSAQAHHARQRLFALDRVPQSGQGEHGHHSRPRCAAGC